MEHPVESVEIWVRRCAARMDEAGLFFGHGTDNAWDEASWLVLHVIGASPEVPFSSWGRPVADSEAQQIEFFLEQRIRTRQPLAYLIGEAWFCGLRFKASPAALVPRSPLAELIQSEFQPWLPEPARRALDLCTGGACIAVAMAAWIDGLQVDALDISAEALVLAAENIALHSMEERVRLRESDLFSAVAGERYDLIVSNPPYVPRTRVEALPEEYQAEPALGLVSGEDGLLLPLRLLQAAPQHLEPDGVLFCEVGESERALENALPNTALTWLEFEHGGGGVITIGQQQLEAAQPDVVAALEQRGHVI
ncbi:MAG: 50S ribosomal protein L3 N(5)-glutamine methyltransferase [Pseudomonadota bacterium]